MWKWRGMVLGLELFPLRPLSEKTISKKSERYKNGCRDEPDFPRGYRRSEAGRPERGDDDEVKVPSLPLGDQRVASGKAALNVQFKKHFTAFFFLPSSRIPSLLKALNRRYSKLQRKTRRRKHEKGLVGHRESNPLHSLYTDP